MIANCLLTDCSYKSKKRGYCEPHYRRLLRSGELGRIQFNDRHGSTHTCEYHIWVSMKQRCFNPKQAQYKHYGARGITVCATWRESFSNFLRDVGLKPGKGYTIDRIDNDGDYEPANVKWSTLSEQGRLIVYNGETHTVAEWSRILGLNHKIIRYRLFKGYSDADALGLKKHGSYYRDNRNIIKG